MEDVNTKIKMRSRRNFHLTSYISSRQTIETKKEIKYVSRRLFNASKDLFQKDLWAHFGCVNAVEFSKDGNLLFSGGDDRRVLMWDVNSCLTQYTGRGLSVQPKVAKACHYSNIFCIAVDQSNNRVLSGGNDDQVIVHDYNTLSPVDYFLHNSPVFALSLSPENGNVFASASDEGQISIYDIRKSNTAPLSLVKYHSPFHGVMYNPAEPELIATAHTNLGVHVWDVRKPQEYLYECTKEHSMAVRWNENGNLLLTLRNLLPPILFNVKSRKSSLEFDSKCYFNACTMKSCTFAGVNDEYVLSGSDDFNLYLWKIPDPWPESGWLDKTHLVLSGHRSIVNQVRYNACKQVIATSGVEKIIKLWSPLKMPYSSGARDVESPNVTRRLCSYPPCYTVSTLSPHDYTQQVMTEDKKMIHFFDSLLREQLNTSQLLWKKNSSSLKKRLKNKPYAKFIQSKIENLYNLLVTPSKQCELKTNSDSENMTSAELTKKYYFSLESNSLVSASEDEELVEESSSSRSVIDVPVNNSSSSTSSSSSSGSSTNRLGKRNRDSGINTPEPVEEEATFRKRKISQRNYRNGGKVAKADEKRRGSECSNDSCFEEITESKKKSGESVLNDGPSCSRSSSSKKRKLKKESFSESDSE